MYRTCLFCTRDLGENQVLETLPIGRRVAFDSRMGRLWVICRACEKWNLVPFDTRLETIDLCERLFRSTKTRFSTDNIGIARLGEGLELVRVGPAERPEFAAWRYGDQFGRRRKRAAWYGAAGTAAVVGAYYIGSTAGITFMVMPSIVEGVQKAWRRRFVATRIPIRGGVGGAVSREGAHESTIVRRGEEWGVGLDLHPNAKGRMLLGSGGERVATVIWGADAVEALGRLLPIINAKGGKDRVISEAVDLTERYSIDDLVARTSSTQGKSRKNKATLPNVSATVRLALEMSAHEQSEREALAGELRLLERQWRDAEEITAISDGLASGPSMDQELERLRRTGE